MADSKHKSQAEKAVSAAKSKNTSAAKKAAAAKPTASKNPPAKSKDTASSAKKTPAKAPVQPETEQGIPPRFFSAVICLGLFVFFIVAVFKPEGALVRFINNIVLGLIGKVAFYISGSINPCAAVSVLYPCIQRKASCSRPYCLHFTVSAGQRCDLPYFFGSPESDSRLCSGIPAL